MAVVHFNTIAKKLDQMPRDLMRLRCLGALSVEEIVSALAKYGIQIPEDDR